MTETATRQEGAGPAPMAVLDLGTNNCRLLIARFEAGGRLKVLDSFSRIVRLGEGVEASGLLSPAAIARTVATLNICADRIRRSGAGQVRCIATQAARLAGNADELVARVREETGLTLEVISAAEEAELVALGCAALVGRQYKGALVFDIGGGSTEIIHLAREDGGTRTRFAASLPLGVVTLAERAPLASRDDYRRLGEELAGRFADVARRMEDFDPAGEHLLGTSGTVTTLAAIALRLPRYIRARVDGSWHRTESLLTVAAQLAEMDQAELAGVGSIGPERADLMLPGCAIFTAICKVWPASSLRVADRGLREGMLRQMAGEVVAA